MNVRTLLVGAAALALLPACTDISGSPTCQVQLPGVDSIARDTVYTNIGLQYVELENGTGTEQVGACDAVNVTMEGELLDGTTFQQPVGVQFIAGATQLRIQGLNVGVYGMREDGKRRLIVPPELGFGAEPQYDSRGNLVVPANSTLVIDVTLINFIDRVD